MNYIEAKAHAMTLLFDTDMVAELVTYNGGDTQIPAVFDFSETISNASADTALVYVAMSDVPSPAYRDTILRGTTTWYVHRDKKTDNVAVESSGMWKMKITTNERFNSWT